eukprot:1139705-Pelagomonas_calceolata.AAC.1
MRRHYAWYQKECPGSPHSNSSGIAGYGQVGRPSFLELPRPILEGQYGCELGGLEVRSIGDMSAVNCCLLCDQGLSKYARPSSADKSCDVQKESVLELRLMSVKKCTVARNQMN